MKKTVISVDYEKERIYFDHNSYILSTCAKIVYESLAKKYNLLFLDAKEVAFAGSDGEHFTRESHISLGNYIYKFLKENQK